MGCRFMEDVERALLLIIEPRTFVADISQSHVMGPLISMHLGRSI